jgi:hypothetical protein
MGLSKEQKLNELYYGMLRYLAWTIGKDFETKYFTIDDLKAYLQDTALVIKENLRYEESEEKVLGEQE